MRGYSIICLIIMKTIKLQKKINTLKNIRLEAANKLRNGMENIPIRSERL